MAVFTQGENLTIHSNIIGDIKESTRLYRVFPRHHFLSLFKENRNALVRPAIWEDPFENVVLKAETVTGNGERGRFGFHDDVYGQCWTLETASDAIWQIYSRGKDAIRVRTTVGKLLRSLAANHGEWAPATCFIGRVDYLSDSGLREFSRTVFKSGIGGEAIARSLLAKRKAYRHENEVRLIYIERSDTKHPDGLYGYALEPRDIIDQIMVDGRVTYDEFLPFKKEVMELTGLSERQVMRSLLYQPPKDFLVEVP